MTIYDFLKMLAVKQQQPLKAALLVHLAAYEVHQDLQRCHDAYVEAMESYMAWRFAA